jgi:hypothetical protein
MIRQAAVIPNGVGWQRASSDTVKWPHLIGSAKDVVCLGLYFFKKMTIHNSKIGG